MSRASGVSYFLAMDMTPESVYRQAAAERSMPFDIYKVGSEVQWIETAAEVDRAKTRVKALAASSPGEYIIANQQTGEKISIKSPANRIMFQIRFGHKQG